MRPSKSADEIILGVLGRALDRYHVDLFGFSFQSNHYHMLIGTHSALQMARFQGFFNGNLAKKLAKLRGWRDKFWARRYRPMRISDEPEAQLARLEYLLANGVKEGLVSSPLDWPGPNMAQTILRAEPLVGTWFDQTKEWAARRRGEDFQKYDYATRYEIELQRLPAFRDLTDEEYRELIAGVVSKIEARTASERAGQPVLGPKRILTQDPHRRPRTVKRSPAPFLLFAGSKETARTMREDYRAFVRCYREASARLLSVQRSETRTDPRSGFPYGSFPPALQFVGGSLRPPPPPPRSRKLEYDETRRKVVERGAIPVIHIPRSRIANPRSASVGVERLRAPPTASPTLSSG